MKVLGLKEFFKEVNYDWEADRESIGEICRLTKTRVNNNVEFDINNLNYGMEQSFLLKAISDWCKPNNIFEIGTGRGTGSYSMALTKSVDTIVTVDIIPSDKKQQTAIGFRAVNVSNKELFEMVPNEEKEKILFQLVNDDMYLCKKCFGAFQMAFIDGDHTNADIIIQDYNKCMDMLEDDWLIVWDDYDPTNFVVKSVADKIAEENGYETLLVEFRGHLFDEDKAEKNSGILLMKKGKIL